MKKIYFKTREEWLLANKSSIGGSKIATICGANPFESPYKLWRVMKGMDEPDPVNWNMRLGNIFEDSVATLWEEETGNKVIKSTKNIFMYQHPDYPYIMVSPDREYRANGGGTGIYEGKTTRSIIDHDNMPERWYFQGNFYCGGSGKKRFVIVWFEWITQEIKWRDFDFNKEFYDQQVKYAVDFWTRYIEGDEEPELTVGSDVSLKWPVEKAGKMLLATTEMEQVYSEIRAFNDKAGIIKSEIEKRKEMVKLAMGDAEMVVYGDEHEKLFTYTANNSTIKVDAERLKREMPIIYERYLIVKPGPRVLRVKE